MSEALQIDQKGGRALLELIAEVVSAYVSKNAVPHHDLPAFIKDIHTSLRRLADGVPEASASISQEPAVSIKRSVQPDLIICLEDGKPLKSLKRHLAAAHRLTPDEYRLKWRLSVDYPLVAPN